MKENVRKLKVVQITHDLDLGGLQQVIVTICRIIDRSRFDMSVLCIRDGGLYRSEVERMGIPVLFIPYSKNKTDYFSFVKVATILKKIKPDVVHTHNTLPFIDGTIAAKIAGVKKIIHTDHARLFPDKKRYMLAEWMVSHFAEKIVGVSEHTSNNLLRYEHINPKRVITILNGIDPFQLQINKEKKKEEISIPQSGLVIGVAVRLSEQKGLHNILEVMPDIIKVYQDVNLVIAGDGPLRNDLQSKAKELKIEKKVHFLGSRSDVPELLRIFDIYVLSSIWEGLPMIVLEAMAAGCPLIATDVGGVREAVTDNENGLLIEPDNKLSLKSALLHLLGDRSLRERFGQNSLAKFKKKFTARKMVGNYEKLYAGEL